MSRPAILDEILARTRADLAARMKGRPLSEVEAAARATPPPRSLAAALVRPGQVTCIAEHKRRSPSAGEIRPGADVASVVTGYARAGAAALSVLTDGPFFGGSLDDLARARASVELPILRKDFIVDRYQIAEARAAGADAVLLIVAALGDRELAALAADARAFGLDVLVETHDEAELDRALALDAHLIGINNRDLRTMVTDRQTALRLRARVPTGRVVVAESGIKTADDVRRLRQAGVDAMLVGESLMKTPDPGATLAALLDGNR